MTADEFRKTLLRQAYQDFLAWAWAKDELMEQWVSYIEECKAQGAWEDASDSFTTWVTETYWGELE